MYSGLYPLQPIQKLPFVTLLPDGLFPKQILRTQGLLGAGHFDINLKLGPKPTDEVAFYASIRPGKKFVFNTFRNGTWGTPVEVANTTNFVVKASSRIDLAIIAEETHYKVTWFGIPIFEYEHTVPLEKVNYVSVESTDGFLYQLGVGYTGGRFSDEPLRY